jgi:hypothetical protein
MVYQTLFYGIMNPSLLVKMRGVIYHEEKSTLGSIYHMKIDLGVKIPYDIGPSA